MSPPRIAVLDYGIGNLRSAEKALQHVGAAARLVQVPTEAAAADGVVLPGVGSFGPSARALRDSGLAEVASEAIAGGVPFLGICVGLQLLFEGSEEDAEEPGLNVLPGRVKRLSGDIKRPQMQWNVVRPDPRGRASSIVASLGDEPWLYFVHSYAPEPSADTVAYCDYGEPVVAAIERNNLWGVQFHPEKSGDTGLRLLSSFVQLCAA